MIGRSMRVICACLLMSATAGATVLIPADLGELSRDARAIVRGRVVAVDGRWTDDRRTIETLVTLDVESTLKGSLRGTIQFRVPGGDLGRYRSIVVGAPQFAVDDHVVVFLGATGPMIPYVLGLNQGVYRMAPGARAGAWMVRGEVPRTRVPLADFEQRVRALAGGAR